MLVERRTYAVKGANRGAMVKVLKEGHKVLDYSPRFRILTPVLAPFDAVVHELEFKDLAEREKFWTDWGTSEKAPAVLEKFWEILELGGGSEIWRVAE